MFASIQQKKLASYLTQQDETHHSHLLDLHSSSIAREETEKNRSKEKKKEKKKEISGSISIAREESEKHRLKPKRKRKEKKNYMSMKKDQTIHKGKVDLKKIWSMKRRMKRLTIKRTR